MISEKYKITSVSITAIRVSHLAPKVATAWVPTPKAPMVWAKVLRIRIAASESPTFSLTRASTAPLRGLSCARLSVKLGVIDSSTASSTEHRKETPIASVR